MAPKVTYKWVFKFFVTRFSSKFVVKNYGTHIVIYLFFFPFLMLKFPNSLNFIIIPLPPTSHTLFLSLRQLQGLFGFAHISLSLYNINSTRRCLLQSPLHRLFKICLLLWTRRRQKKKVRVMLFFTRNFSLVLLLHIIFYIVIVIYTVKSFSCLPPLLLALYFRPFWGW